MGKKNKVGPEARKIMAARGRELGKKQKEYPDRKMAWIGGKLYFTDTRPPEEVPGAKKLPKKGEAKGLEGALPSSGRGRISSSSQAIYFRDLPEAIDTNGQCCECHKYPNPKITVKTKDEGDKEVVICGNCGSLMRPLKRRPRFS